ncbi:hypothetical protein HPB50_017299 [Hyalomma asiaticum]|uniref:Uncharacterized protein n=1 Tax=Hyalomma asiaticum TaxID=266040 RepID=A0ACB7RJT9_HYAAI|nr:hypothetical protein HPB50_017299 [Hyalomma asiaticum]
MLGRGPLVPDCRELCLVVSRVKRGKPSAELPHRSRVEQHFGTDGAVLDGAATCNRHARVFNEAPEAEVEPVLFQASPGRRYRAEERETWSTGLLSPVSFPACRGVPCDDSYTSLLRIDHIGARAPKQRRKSVFSLRMTSVHLTSRIDLVTQRKGPSLRPTPEQCRAAEVTEERGGRSACGNPRDRGRESGQTASL